ncbi:hypothetical protein C8J56DRAFT_979698 [Mycena floridula]|nr:hypothetical protein C8J56DRAFT_979698 [Mycena floridula]
MSSSQVALCPSTLSSVSINLLDIADASSPILLSDSFSLDSIWSVCSDLDLAIPPFPPGCMVPMSTIIGIKSNLNMLAGGCGVEGLYEHHSVPNVTTTVPTPPRLRTMLKENLCIKKWVRNLATAGAPEHTPWTSTKSSAPKLWIPEGSIHTPEAFKEALANARRIIPKPQKRPRSQYRDALVFEREITLRTGDKTQRWSLQVPASSMKAEVVDMVLELRNLNSFFQDKPILEEEEKAVEEMQKIEPPSLMISNSQFMIPLSLESSGNLDLAQAPAPLAERRGKKMPPQLKFKPAVEEDLYPGMPTAFLGTPSAYSPEFQLPSHDRASSPGLHDMVRNLRSQAATLKDLSSDPPVLIEERLIDHLPLPISPVTPTSIADEEDWGFSDPVMDGDLDNDESGPAIEKDEDAPSSPPTTPASSLSSPRGILKRCKSVRFASQPSPEPLPQIQRLSRVVPRYSVPLRHFSPLRQTHSTPKSNSGITSPQTSPIKSCLKSPETTRPPSYIQSPMPLRVSLPQLHSSPPRMSTPVQKKSIKSARLNISRPVLQTASLGRRSMIAVKEKENDARATISGVSSRSRMILDENTFKAAGDT